MIELPESLSLSDQINKTLHGKRISSVTAGHTPHKLAWYYGDRSRYSNLLVGKSIHKAVPCGSMVEISAEGANILFGVGSGSDSMISIVLVLPNTSYRWNLRMALL
jgi:formamidopyrimidine-DNA glycosylase